MPIPFDLMVEITEQVLSPWRGFGLSQPTEASVGRIQEELGTTLPAGLVSLARKAPSYGSWFAGLGEDFDHPLHSLTLNREFHAPDQEDGYAPLPDHLILVNHGHDGDCDCWDVRHVTATGEHPIVYVDFTDGSVDEGGHPSFELYLDAFCRAFGPGVDDAEAATRVREILESHPH